RTLENSPADGDAERATHWKAIRDEIRAEVCTKAYDADRKTFVQCYGSKNLDAALLMMPLVGFLPPTDERMQGPVAAIEKDLATEGFVARYSSEEKVDGLPPGEGVFLPCTFWLADNLALMGRVDHARALFGRLIGLANDVGLLAEEYDPDSKRQLGNFPQAFTHVSLVNSASRLSALASADTDQTSGPRHRERQPQASISAASHRPGNPATTANSTAVPGEIRRVPSAMAVQWNEKIAPSSVATSPTPRPSSKLRTEPRRRVVEPVNGRSWRSAAR